MKKYKWCIHCAKKKDIEEFYVHPQMADGRLNSCKSCQRSRVGKNRRRKREQYSAYEKAREQRPERQKKKREYQRRHRKLHPDKLRARKAVARAVASGKLIREPCKYCGCKKYTQAHHKDYSKPLEVEWACFKCHRQEEHGQVVVSSYDGPKPRKKGS